MPARPLPPTPNPVAQFGAYAALGAHCPGSYKRAVTTADGSTTLPAGWYKVWVTERAGGAEVWFRFGATVAVPVAAAAVSDDVFGMAADETEQLYVDGDAGALHYIATLACTLNFSRLA